MSTLSKEVVEDIIAGKYPEDKWVKAVTYNNDFNGALCYAAVHARDDYYGYERSPFCHNVTVIWEKKGAPAPV